MKMKWYETSVEDDRIDRTETFDVVTFLPNGRSVVVGTTKLAFVDGEPVLTEV